VWMYLHARNAPLEMAAGYVGTALEFLVRGYYEQPQNELRSKLLSNTVFSELLLKMKETVKTSKTLASNESDADKFEVLSSKLASLTSVSGKKLTEMLLCDLGLENGEVEKRALKARARAVHADSSDRGFETLTDYRALHTLFARVVFRVLDLDATYVDYSSLNFPSRPLGEKQGP
jgi:hypothetical protein